MHCTIDFESSVGYSGGVLNDRVKEENGPLGPFLTEAAEPYDHTESRAFNRNIDVPIPNYGNPCNTS